MTSAFQAMYNLLQTDRRYKFEAYNFVRESLNVAQERMRSTRVAAGEESTSDDDSDFAPVTNHITPQELCEACRLHAIDQFGLMASKVLANWGVTATGDFGEIVFNLIRIDQMRKSDSDHREDFDDVYEFGGAFAPQFELPTQSSE